MELSNFKPLDSSELAVIDNLDLNSEIFNDILDKIVFCMKKLNIRMDDKCVYYQRSSNKTSILAIKVSNGDDCDVANFMFNGCDATSYHRYMLCDVYLHAEAKSGQASMNIANMISRDIVDFFNTMEGELALKGLSDAELSIRIPLVSDTKKKEEGKFLKLIRNVFKK